MNRIKKLSLNTVSSLLLQITTVICGFIVPRLILGKFGSEVNGLVSSIGQFLQLITFLELGVGAVIQSSLYKPLSEKDYVKTGQILNSAGKFFRRIALILVFYVAVLLVMYPLVIDKSHDWMYTALLIAAMSISSFAQYLFGVVDRLLLTADQKGFIQYSAQIVTLLLNTGACALLIYLNASIQMVKLVASLIFLIRPLFLRIYVSRKYKINRREKYDSEPISQKWSGIAPHISFVILEHTDVVVLTLFAGFADVSIYYVYHMVIYGVKQLLTSATEGLLPLLGNMWAKGEKDNTNRLFNFVEWIINTGVMFVFGCTAMLILPFVQVYTKGITDANYIQPLFSVLLVVAHGLHCLRLPYHMMVKVTGHYKQTQLCYIIAAVLNIVISIVTVIFWGLIGVAIGTLVAMLSQTIWLKIYSSKRLLKNTIKAFIKQMIVNLITAVAIYFSTFWIALGEVSYGSWIIMALKVAGIIFADIVIINLVFYYKNIDSFAKKIITKMRRRNNVSQ